MNTHAKNKTIRSTSFALLLLAGCATCGPLQPSPEPPESNWEQSGWGQAFEVLLEVLHFLGEGSVSFNGR
ncbi:MAG: hypothetical protein U1F83_12975 [Verrucomicrobiota bacterium]